MDLITDDITIECSRLKAFIILFLGIPVLSLISLVLVVIMIAIPLKPNALEGMGMQNLATLYLLFPVLVIAVFWSIWVMIRNREALFTTIQISAGGVIVQNSRYGVLVLSWNDVTHATYSRIGKMMTLESPKLSAPLVIMNFASRSIAPEFLAARSVTQAAVGNRWSERLLYR